MCVRGDRVHKAVLQPAIQLPALKESALQHRGRIDLTADAVLFLQAGQRTAAGKAGVALNVRQQHPVAAAGDLPQGRFHFRRRHIGHELQQHPVGAAQRDQAVLGRRIGRSRGIQQLRASFQREVIALFPAIGAGKVQMPQVQLQREGLHARRAVRGGKQTGDPIRRRRIQHGKHLFPRAGTVVHTIDEMRVIIRKAAHFFSAACLCL